MFLQYERMYGVEKTKCTTTKMKQYALQLLSHIYTIQDHSQYTIICKL